MEKQKKIYVCTLTKEQSDQLRTLMEERGWQFDSMQYAYWRGKKDRTNVVSYESGKLKVDGSGTAEFVQYLLEPEILKEYRFGYEIELAEIEHPDMFQPHAGIDESGKGEFFGPLVFACCYIDGHDMARRLLESGVTDSKKYTTDNRVCAMADLVRKEVLGRFNIITLMPETYNRLYASIGNLDRLMAWGHAKTLENVLEIVPSCPRAISDQFDMTGRSVPRALLERGKRIKLEQYPKAEADVAVAAASILARAELIRRRMALSEQLGMQLPKGADAKVVETAHLLAQQGGAELLAKYAKMHFNIAKKALEWLDEQYR